MNPEKSNHRFREIIKSEFGIDLPITGGIGNSIENAVIIERTPLNDYVAVEYEVLKYIALGRDLFAWKVIKQHLVIVEGNTYDKLEVLITMKNNGQLTQQLEYHYFDITACFGPEKFPENETDQKLAEMKLFLDKLKEEIDKKN